MRGFLARGFQNDAPHGSTMIFATILADAFASPAASPAAASAAVPDPAQAAQAAADAPAAPVAEIVASDPTREAMVRIVRNLQSTEFGQWLQQHEAAWNAIAIASLFVLGFGLNLLIRRIVSAAIARVMKRAGRHALAKAIVDSKIVVPLAAIVPLLLVARVLTILGEAGVINPVAATPVSNIATAFAILRGLTAFGRGLQVADELYSARPEVNRPGALRGYRQVAMVLVGLSAGISAAAIAVGKSPVVFLAALGAAGAILGVVFKDVLFSLVANLMLTANDALRVGDWVELKQHSIDGRIAEIKTTSVRVQNADGTVHSVPISRFVQEPYLNYRSKYGSPGRRMRRSLRVDLRTVRALEAGELSALAANRALAGTVERARQAAGDAPVTNLCVFRSFAERMLASHEGVDTSLPVVVSQPEPTPNGQPVDVLCFIRPNAAPDLASVEGALLDRLSLALPCFGLRSYQTGSDLGPNPGALAFLAPQDLAAAGVAQP
ncbi:MAG: mechanosensitive ion channel domain-containing protein [Planctomycetota bacterium]